MKKSAFVIFLFSFSISLFSQDTLLFKEPYIPYQDTTIVFIPDNYNKANAHPLIFMLHGYSGNYHQWNDITDLKKEANKDGFIIVCPDGFYNSWYFDSPADSTIQFENFFFNNLVPAIFKRYNIDRSNIFITGLSMGGHGAMYLFLKHPDFFKSAGSTSGITDLMPFPNNWEIKNVLGAQDKNINVWMNHSDINLLGNIKNKGRQIIVDCGTEDFAYDLNEKFAQACRKNGIDITFITGPGDHNYNYWAKSIKKHFSFFNSLLKKK